MLRLNEFVESSMFQKIRTFTNCMFSHNSKDTYELCYIFMYNKKRFSQIPHEYQNHEISHKLKLSWIQNLNIKFKSLLFSWEILYSHKFCMAINSFEIHMQ